MNYQRKGGLNMHELEDYEDSSFTWAESVFIAIAFAIAVLFFVLAFFGVLYVAPAFGEDLLRPKQEFGLQQKNPWLTAPAPVPHRHRVEYVPNLPSLMTRDEAKSLSYPSWGCNDFDSCAYKTHDIRPYREVIIDENHPWQIK
jgi:hypothetical protein